MRRLPEPGTAVVPGTLVGLVVAAALLGGLVPLRSHVGAPTPALLLTLVVGGTALLGGSQAACLVAVAAAVGLDLLYLRPYGTVSILTVEDSVALVVFLVVALTVGLLVAAQGARRREAEERERELVTLGEVLDRLGREREQLGERARQADDLARLDDQRSALLRSVSHDLRTPLSVISAIATDLRDGTVYDAATTHDLLSLVVDEAERLDRLVANLLSLSRIEAGAFTPERQAVDVQELVLDRLHQLGSLFGALRVHSELPDDLPLVDGDYAQLEQVVTNLLANLARHAPPGSDVWVIARGDEHHVQLEVSDRGEGIPETEWARIFEPFQRGAGSTSSGIGLAICKAIVEAHGGSIYVEHTFGGGATFVVVLPARSTRVDA
jgi:two-component system sensor histidine kinase KdpD